MIKPAASEADIAFVESHRADLPVLELMMVQRRRYRTAKCWQTPSATWAKYPRSNSMKATAIIVPAISSEKPALRSEYNDQLEGTDGMRRVIVNSVGKAMRTLDNVEAIPGKPIQLTIDYDLQAIAEADMADKEGAVVAMDGRTGEVLAMVSRPDVRSQRFRRANSHGRMAEAQYGSGNAAAESRHTGPARSRLRIQNCDGYGDARIESDARELTRPTVPATPTFYGRDVPLLTTRTACVDLHKAIVDFLRCFLLQRWQNARNRPYRPLRHRPRPGPAHRISTCQAKKPGLIPSEEWVQRVYHHKWYAGRDDLSSHRAGSRDGHARFNSLA